MGVPLPPLEESSHQQHERPIGATTSARPAGGAQRRFSPGGFGALSAADDARLRSLSSLLAFTRSVAPGIPPPPLRPPAAAPAPRPPPAAFTDLPPNSPPPLAEESDGELDWDGNAFPLLVPNLPPASPPPLGVDDVCPWGLMDEDDESDDGDGDALMQGRPLLRPARDALGQPAVRRALPRVGSASGGVRGAPGGSAGDGFLAPLLRRQPLRVLPSGSGAAHAARPQAAAAGVAQPLEAELAGMAARLAELARQHQGSMHPGMLSGLQDAANLLQGLARDTGPPSPA